jgi:hypothetical protein
VRRVRAQRAEIGYFADAEGEQDRSIG